MDQKTYVLIGHGSPKAAGNKHLIQFAQKLEAHLGQKVYYGALEHFEPDVPAVLEAACTEGVGEEVVVMPLFLFAAYHCKKDIPPYIDAVRKKFPHKKIHYAPALGSHPKMLDIVFHELDKIEALSRYTVADQTVLLFIGRGTSDQEVIVQFKQIGHLIAQARGFKHLEFAFMAVNHPTIEEALELCRQTPLKRVIVVPYLLFYGVLVEKITKNFLDIAREQPEKEVYVTKVLGNHSNLIEALLERSKEEAPYG